MAGQKIKSNHDQRRNPNKRVSVMPQKDLKHIIEKNSVSNQDEPSYFDRNHKEITFMSEAKLRRLADRLCKWAANDPAATYITKFFKPEGIGTGDAYKWCKKWPWFAEEYKHAKEMVAERLFDGSLVRAYDGAMVRPVLPMLHDDFRQETDRIAKQKLEIAAMEPPKMKTIVTHMIKYTDEEGTVLEDKADKKELKCPELETKTE